MASYYFTIIGTRDNPLYELEFSSFKSASNSAASTNNIPGRSNFPGSVKEILPFISNSSIDLIEDIQWSTKEFSLGKIDSFYGLLINAFITQGNIKFLLCYDLNSGNSNSSGGSNLQSKNEDNSIKQFFMEVNELYVKCLLNPFYSVNDAIISPDFDLKLKMLARKYL